MLCSQEVRRWRRLPSWEAAYPCQAPPQCIKATLRAGWRASGTRPGWQIRRRSGHEDHTACVWLRGGVGSVRIEHGQQSILGASELWHPYPLVESAAAGLGAWRGVISAAPAEYCSAPPQRPAPLS
eukprot:scaffold1444_cov134-Isochrysis_galbana.AAC.4